MRARVDRSRVSWRASAFSRSGGADGFILIAVLVVVLLLSMVAVSLLFRMKAEDTASTAAVGTEQAWAAALSGIEEAKRLGKMAASGSLEWQDSPRLFKDRFVFDDGADQWRFTVYSAGDSESRDEVRYGLTDEASKANLNHMELTNLAVIPGLTRPLIETLADFMDSDDTPHPEGAEQEYYDGLPRPYKIRNGPLATLDELLLVRGITPALFYGEDANMNLALDANENDSDQTFPPDNGDGRLDPGLRQYLTVSSYEWNESREGAPRVNVNEPEEALPAARLPAALTQYITALRSNKISVAHVADLLEAKHKVKDSSGSEVEIESGVGKEELPVALDLLTASYELRLSGLININTASARVLATVPGIDEALAEAIVSARRGLSADKRRTIAWLFTEDLVPAERFRQLAPYLTARGLQFSFHVAGYGTPSGRFRVLEVMIDCASSKPSVLYTRDLTRLGMPFRLQADEAGVAPAARTSGGARVAGRAGEVRGG